MSTCSFCKAPLPTPAKPCPACGRRATEHVYVAPREGPRPARGAASAPNVPAAPSPDPGGVPDLDLPGGPPPPRAARAPSTPDVRAPDLQAPTPGAPDLQAPDLRTPDLPAPPPPAAPAAGPPLQSSMRELDDGGGGGGGLALELDDVRAPSPSAPEIPPGSGPSSSQPNLGSQPGMPAAPASDPSIPGHPPSGPQLPAGWQPPTPPVPAAPPPPPTPAQVIAHYPAPPDSPWGAPSYAVRVLIRQFELRQDLTSLRRRRSPDVSLYEAALTAHDHRYFAIGMAMTLAGVAVVCLFVSLPVIARFVMAP